MPALFKPDTDALNVHALFCDSIDTIGKETWRSRPVYEYKCRVRVGIAASVDVGRGGDCDEDGDVDRGGDGLRCQCTCWATLIN